MASYLQEMQARAAWRLLLPASSFLEALRQNFEIALIASRDIYAQSAGKCRSLAGGRVSA